MITNKTAITAVSAAVVIAIVGIIAGFRAGYRDGQLDYARHKLRWSIMDGIIVEFHGVDGGHK